MEERFYVYQLLNVDGSIAYIGKGSGRRLKNQQKIFGLSGDILEYHKSEKMAYARECHFIAELKPTLNKHSGGNGSRAIPIRPRKYKWEKEFEIVGNRRYTARMLLQFDLSKYLSSSKIEQIRQVAIGPKC